MKSDMLFMLQLIGAVINEQELPEAAENINWDEISNISVRHQVANIIAYGIMSGDYNLDEELKKRFMKLMSDSMALDMRQEKAFAELFEEFEEKKIDHMPLKGLVIKKLYPSPDMRNMSDGDILIRENQMDKIKPVMEQLGYKFKLESNHELVYVKSPFINAELHKMLIPSYNDDLYEYYGDGWKLAVQCDDGCGYKLSDEDLFVYLVSHFAKHYRDAGVGIKHVTDLWLFRKKVTSLDMTYVYKQLEKLNLKAFYDKISVMLECWFSSREYDDVSAAITMFILSSGVFGNVKNEASAAALRNYMDKDITKASKYKYLRLVFPDYEYMKGIYPALGKAPWLLPFMWVVRLVTGVLLKRKNIEHHMSRTSNTDDSYIAIYSKHMEMVGLDIYNGRKKEQMQ